MTEAGAVSFGDFVNAATRSSRLVVQPRMGFSDPAKMRAGLLATKRVDAVTVGTITLDSYTRLADHAAARAALAAGSDLNGYPLVDHPTATTLGVLAGVHDATFPIQVRHGSPRPQQIIAAMKDAGLHATEGGPISYCLPYSRVPVDEAVRAWASSTRSLAELRESGIRPHLESFGGCMMGQLCPPALLVALSVLECVFFASHGIDSVSLSYAQQTNPAQDEEALAALRRLATEFLGDLDWHIVVYTYMGMFPRTTEGATRLLMDAARLSVRTGAARLIVKTVAEARRIPTVAENVAALAAAAHAAAGEYAALAVGQPPPTSDTGLYLQARAIIEAVLNLDPDLDVALVRGVRDGLLDVPYCLHSDNVGRTRAVVGRDGTLQWTELGALPLRGIAEVGDSSQTTAASLLRSLSYVERRFDDEALERAAATKQSQSDQLYV
jgi:methylaspartate mutase epsilon subunit